MALVGINVRDGAAFFRAKINCGRTAQPWLESRFTILHARGRNIRPPTSADRRRSIPLSCPVFGATGSWANAAHACHMDAAGAPALCIETRRPDDSSRCPRRDTLLGYFVPRPCSRWVSTMGVVGGRADRRIPQSWSVPGALKCWLFAGPTAPYNGLGTYSPSVLPAGWQRIAENGVTLVGQQCVTNPKARLSAKCRARVVWMTLVWLRRLDPAPVGATMGVFGWRADS